MADEAVLVRPAPLVVSRPSDPDELRIAFGLGAHLESGRTGRDPSGRVALAVTVGVVWAGIVALVAVTIVLVWPRHNTAPSTKLVMLSVPAPYVPVAPVPVAAPVVRAAANTPAPIGNWTAQRGVAIAERALSWVGWPYSWDAGDAQGPTLGQAVDAASRNDGHIVGFDCSGLVMYALGPWLALDHSAAAQYHESGSVHPSLAQLQPGDLIFWSKDGTVDGIGHVAIYVGNGDVVQAPYSGAKIDVVPLNQVESGRIGVTRPLT